MRLYKYIKTYGNYTNSEVTKLYQEGRIKVNGNIIPYLWILNENDIVTIDDKVLEKFPFVYYLYYKPKGIRSDIISEATSYLKKLNLPYKVVPVGRLDKESEGLMILTNDGNFINELNDHSNNYTKDYLVTLKEKITPNFLENVKEPFIIKDKKTLPIIIKQLDDYRALFTLQDGKYHQIRRAVIRSNNTVVLLKRVRIGPFTIGDLKPNELKEFKTDLNY